MKKYFIYRYSYDFMPGYRIGNGWLGFLGFTKEQEAYTPIGYNKRAKREFGESTEFVTEYGIYRKPIGDGEGVTIILSVGVADLLEHYQKVYPKAVVWVYEI